MSKRVQRQAMANLVIPWARARGVRESATRHPCLHGLLRRGRRYGCACDGIRLAALDHARLWVKDGRPAFLLAHTYHDVRPGAMVRQVIDQYAADHGVRVVIGDPADDWYGHGTTPVRYEVAS